MNQILRWVINLAVIYALMVGVMLLARRPLIYPFVTEQAFLDDLEGVGIRALERPDGSKLVVWAAEPRAKKPVIFYFMGNVGNLGYFRIRLRSFVEEGYGLVAMAYRGGGGADGKPSELTLTEDAKFLWDNVEGALRIRIPESQRVIYGESLGTGVAANLAAQTMPMAVVLQVPFTRLCEAIEATVKIVPACRLMWDEFYPIVDQVEQIEAPMLVLHGTDDTTIPVYMGELVARAAPNAELVLYPGGQHNNLRLHGADRDTIAFINRVMTQNSVK